MGPTLGVFDSGVGGLTVVAALREALPDVSLHYIADSANAPYGERGHEFILERSEVLVARLLANGAALIVIACNTATAHAAEALRKRHPSVPIVGIEPGIKPAVVRSRNHRIGVLATRATVESARFKALVARHAGDAQVTAVACSGIVKRIEEGDLGSAALRGLVADYCRPLVEAGVDTVLLGCTHYPLIRGLWAEALGAGVELVQVESAVAREAARRWPLVQTGKARTVIEASSVKTVDLLLETTRDANWLQQIAWVARVDGGATIRRLIP